LEKTRGERETRNQKVEIGKRKLEAKNWKGEEKARPGQESAST
jgi:hypothetical protein